MQLLTWSHLNRQQLGAYAEYFVKMQFTMLGFQVYRTELDDRGVDFVVRYEKKPFIEIQVKSARTAGYVFVQKAKFELSDSLYLALALFTERRPPDLFLIPSSRWKSPDKVFVSRDYVGLQSQPEWGINLSKKNLPAIESYGFDLVATSFRGEKPNKAPEPTPTAVTPRAMEMKSERRNSSAESNEARVVPAAGVAHL